MYKNGKYRRLVFVSIALLFSVSFLIFNICNILYIYIPSMSDFRLKFFALTRKATDSFIKCANPSC